MNEGSYAGQLVACKVAAVERLRTTEAPRTWEKTEVKLGAAVSRQLFQGRGPYEKLG